MKNLWFHLMPYKDLPDDFRDIHPSFWVDINSKRLDTKRFHQHYNEHLDELEYAGHLPEIDNPEMLVREINAFLLDQEN